MRNYYAGVGSRQTPQDVLDLMEKLAACLASDGWTLRSGHAEGADYAFECGADGKSEIFLPWPWFNSQLGLNAGFLLEEPAAAAFEVASRTHPYWAGLSQGAKRLHARNVHQIVGPELDRPVRFVVCWTPDGVTSDPTPKTGGTGQAIRIAAECEIPVFNLQRDQHREWAEGWIADRGTM